MGQSTCFYFIFTAKQLRQSLSFNKVAGLRHKCFPVNFQKFLRTPPDDYFFTVLTIVKYINKWTHKAKKNNTLVSRNVSDEKNLHPCGRKMFFINLIQFSKQILHLKTTLTVIFFLKNKGALSFIVWREKCKYMRINLLVEIFLFWCFFETKIYISYTFDLFRRVVNKIFSPGRFPKQDYFFRPNQM